MSEPAKMTIEEVDRLLEMVVANQLAEGFRLTPAEVETVRRHLLAEHFSVFGYAFS